MTRFGAMPVLVARAGSIAASFALTVVVARVLPLAEAGGFFLVLSVAAVAATFGRFGADTFVLKRLAGSSAGMPELRALSALVTIASLAAGVCVALVFAAWGPGGLSFGGAIAAGAMVLPQALAVVAGAVLRSTNRMVAGVIAELGTVPATTAVLVMAFALGGWRDIDSAVAALAIASFATAAWSCPLAVRAARARRLRSTLPALLMDHGRSLTSMMGTALLFYIVTWAPVFVLSFAGRYAEVALVTAAARLAGFITLVPNIQVSYLAPRFAALYRANDTRALSRAARGASRLALLIVAVPALALVVFPGAVLRLVYGPELADAALALALLSGAALVSVAAGQVNQLMLLGDLEHSALVLNAAVAAAWATVGVALAFAVGLAAVAGLAAVLTAAYSSTGAILLSRVRGIRSFV